MPQDAGSTSKGDWTIEQILQEKKAFDLSVNFEKLGVDNEDKGWHEPAPTTPVIISSLPSSSNILNATVGQIVLPGQAVAKPCLLASTADRRLSMVVPDPRSFELFRSCPDLQDSPILDTAVIDQKYLIVSSMSGRVKLYDCRSEGLLDERKDHTKYVVKVASWQDSTTAYIATAGWDAKIVLYHLRISEGVNPRFGEPLATMDLPSNPEAILFIEHTGSTRPLLLLTRRDSTYLYYYSLPTLTGGSREFCLLGKQNLAPHSNAWVAFTPAAVAICPTDPSILAVATSAVPYMKLIILRLLVPPHTSSPVAAATGRSGHMAEITPHPVLELRDVSATTQASQARAALLLQDRESAAILVQCSTLSPQTQYSTPALAWRPDGSGVWVNSDDGVIRGIEASTGKLVASLEGHEPGSKIRCLWAGQVRIADGDTQINEEWVVSGGFDQKLIVWRAQ